MHSYGKYHGCDPRLSNCLIVIFSVLVITRYYKCCSYSSEHINFLDNSDIVGQDNQTQIQMQEKNTHQGKEKQLSRPRQQKTNSRCLNSNDSVLVSSYFDSVEEVIYSQGELYPEEPFDRKWDSEEDSDYNEDYILPSGRI